MKILMLIVILLSFSISGFADGKMNCIVQEVVANEETSYLTLEVPITDEGHGSIINFKLSRLTRITGMVAYLKGFAVISLYDDQTKVASSSHSDVTNGKIAHHQLMLNGPANETLAVVVDCK